MPNDLSNDPTCVSLWRFESGALTTDSRGTNTLTASAAPPTESTSIFQEGACAAAFAAFNPNYYYIADSALASNFPLKSGTSNKTISVCMWWRETGALGFPAEGTSYTLWAKSQIPSSGTMGLFVTTQGGVSYFESDLCHPDGTPSESINHGTALSVSTFYHVSFGYRDSDRAFIFFVRDTAGNTVGLDLTGTAADNIGLFSTSDWMIGAFGSSASNKLYMSGRGDEVILFNELISAGKATDISKGIFSVAAAPALHHVETALRW